MNLNDLCSFTAQFPESSQTIGGHLRDDEFQCMLHLCRRTHSCLDDIITLRRQLHNIPIKRSLATHKIPAHSKDNHHPDLGRPGSKKKRTKRKIPTSAKNLDFQCQICATVTTPKWRRAPDGLHLVCNVCGLMHAKRLQREAEAVAQVQLINHAVLR